MFNIFYEEISFLNLFNRPKKKNKIDGHFGDLCYFSRLESALGHEGAGFEVLLS